MVLLNLNAVVRTLTMLSALVAQEQENSTNIYEIVLTDRKTKMCEIVKRLIWPLQNYCHNCPQLTKNKNSTNSVVKNLFGILLSSS